MEKAGGPGLGGSGIAWARQTGLCGARGHGQREGRAGSFRLAFPLGRARLEVLGRRREQLARLAMSS